MSLEPLVLANAPKTSRYNVGPVIGAGTWATVFDAIRILDGSRWALKTASPTPLAQQQAKERGIDAKTYWEKESLNGLNKGHTNVATSILELDDTGKPFLAVEYVDRFLDDYLEQNGRLDLTESLRIARDIARGVGFIQRKAQRAHGDLHPGNIGYETDGTVKVIDFGSSTVWEPTHDAVRSEIGNPFVRAPELSFHGSHPSTTSDVFSIGCLLYKMIHGQYPLEPELRAAENPSKYIRSLDEKQFDGLVSSRVNTSPLRETLDALLRYNPRKRIRTANGAANLLQGEIESRSLKRRKLRNSSLIAAGTIAAAVIVGGIASVKIAESIHEPWELRMPEVQLTQDHPTMRDPLDREQVRLQSELSFLDSTLVFTNDKHDQEFKNATENRIVAYLMKCYDQAYRDAVGNLGQVSQLGSEAYVPIHIMGGSSRGKINPASASGFYMTREGELATLAEHIGQAFKWAKIPDPIFRHTIVDLDDVATITVVGVETWDRARRVSDSLDFKAYVDAEDFDERVIPEERKNIILKMIGYAQLEHDGHYAPYWDKINALTEGEQ